MKKLSHYLGNSVKEALLVIKLITYVALPIIVLALPVNYFDKEGESICLSVRLAGMECYACGMTSAVKHLLHFDFEIAYAYNMLSFIVTPILIYLWIRWFIIDAKYYYTYRNEIKNANFIKN